MLNSIGLDNDGIEAFVEHHLPYLARFGVPIIVSIAGKYARGVRGDDARGSTGSPESPRWN